MNLHKTKDTTDMLLLLQDHKKVSISILFEKVFLDCNLSPIIDRRGIGIRIPCVKKSEKLISGEGRLLGTQEYAVLQQ